MKTLLIILLCFITLIQIAVIYVLGQHVLVLVYKYSFMHDLLHYSLFVGVCCTLLCILMCIGVIWINPFKLKRVLRFKNKEGIEVIMPADLIHKEKYNPISLMQRLNLFFDNWFACAEDQIVVHSEDKVNWKLGSLGWLNLMLKKMPIKK